MDHRRLWGVLVVGLVIAGLLSGCNGDGSDKEDERQPETTQISVDDLAEPDVVAQRPAAERARPTPVGEPFEFEAPLSVGTYRRESLDGQPAVIQGGGLRALYRSGEASILVTVYYFSSSAKAVESVRTVMHSGNVIEYITRPYYDQADAFGLVYNENGYLAAWCRGKWMFVVRSPSSLDDLDAFLEKYPY